MPPMRDPLPLAQALIRCPSVTPADGGAMPTLAGWLETLGFTVTRLRFGAIENLFAIRGEGAPHLCFAGHTDVVPPGAAAWAHPPFAAEVTGGRLIGRGACDMKGAIAAWVAALATVLAEAPPRGTQSLLITGDEEGEATDGTVRVLAWMAARGIRPDFCLVGEPTSQATLGDTIKIGRRGSLNASIAVPGVQGHVAYPHLADNPVHRLLDLLGALKARVLDQGSADFAPSSLQITSVDVGNPAGNVIPAEARARLNIRFNDTHRGADLAAWIGQVAAAHAPAARVSCQISGEAFLTPPGPFTDLLAGAIAAETGALPARDTGGGTSDARFIAAHCPVAEFGLVGASMHKADEYVPVAELRRLARIYAGFIRAVAA